VSELDTFLAEPTWELPKPGQRVVVGRGLSMYQNTRNPFLVVTLRYEADPKKDPLTEEGRAWLIDEQRDLGCYRICRSCDRPLGIEDESCPECGDETELILSNKWKREYEIDYQAQAGSYVFDAFSRARNTCKPFRIPPSWRRYRSIDHGVRNPTAVLWIAVDPDRHVWVYAEHYEAEKTIDHHARRIHDISARIDYHALGLTGSDLRRMEMPDWTPTEEFIKRTVRLYRTIGDPSMANRTQKEMKTVRQRYADHGIYIARANNAGAGLETINSMFSAGTLTIFETCENLIREVEHLVWDEHVDPAKNKKERPVDRDDHGVDALKYFVNEFAPASKELELPRRPVLTGDERAELDRERFRKRYERPPRTHDDILDV